MPDWPLIATRFALYADLALLFGVPLFGLYALKGDTRRLVPFRPVILILVGAGLALSLLGFAVMAAAMTGAAIGDVDRATLAMLITETSPGWALLSRLAALMILVPLAMALPRRAGTTLGFLAASAGAALATLAWSGHAAATEGTAGVVHLGADIVHLLAAGAWLGALFGLAWMVFGGDADAEYLRMMHRALAGFAGIGTVFVATIILTGGVNGWFLVGPDHVLDLATGRYGQLLAVKLVLFGLMLGMAALNRFRLTPALGEALASGEPASALPALRRSIAIEAMIALLILALVAWLGTLAPPAGS